MRFSSFMLLAGSLVLFGCNRKDGKDNSAPFILDVVSHHGSDQQTAVSAAWPFLREQLSHLRLCVKDRATLEAIVDEPFSVTGAAYVETRRTDANGCFIVPTRLQYNDLAAESYVTQDFVLKNDGRYAGQRKLSVARSPWTHGLLDLRFHSSLQVVAANEATHALLGLHRFDPTLTFRDRTELPVTNLHVDEVRMRFQSESHSPKEGTHLGFELDFSPLYRRKRLDGQFKAEPIQYGKLRVQLRVWEANGTNPFGTFLGGSVRPSEARVQEGQARVEAIDLRVRNARPESVLTWLLSVEPIAEEGGLLSFHGKFVSTLQNLRSALAGRLTEIAVADIPLVPGGVGAIAVEAPKSHGGWSADAPGFYGENASLAPSNIPPQIDRQTHQATRHAHAVFCLRRNVDHEPMRGHSVRIAVSDRPGAPPTDSFQPARLDQSGCISEKTNPPSPLFSVLYSHYGEEQELTRYIVVESQEARFKDIRLSLPVRVVPWRPELSRPLVKSAPAALRGSAQLNITAVSIESPADARPEYALDARMNLTTHEAFRMVVTPSLIRPYLVKAQGPAEQQSLVEPETKLRLRTVLTATLRRRDAEAKGFFDGYWQKLRYVSGFDATVTVREQPGNVSPTIATPIVFAHEYSEGTLFGGMYRLFIELAPLSKDSALRPVTVAVDIEPTRPQPSYQLVRSPLTIAALTESLVPTNIPTPGLELSLRSLELGRILGGGFQGLCESPVLRKPKVRYLPPEERLFPEYGRMSKDEILPLEEFFTSINREARAKAPNHPEPLKGVVALGENGDEIRWPKELQERQKNAQLYLPYLTRARRDDDFKIPFLRVGNKSDGEPVFTLNTYGAGTDHGYRTLAKEFCDLYTDKQSDLSACAGKDTFRYVRMELFEFVEDVRRPPQLVRAPEQGRLETRLRFFKEDIRTHRNMEGRNESTSDEKGRTHRLSMEAVGSGTGVFRNFVQRDQVYWASELSRTTDERVRAEILQSRPFDFSSKRFLLSLKTRRCLLVRPGPRSRFAETASPSFMFCAPSSNVEYEDSWFSLGTSFAPNLGLSIQDIGDTDMRLLRHLRGEFMLKHFERTMADVALRTNLLQSSNTYGPTHILNEVFEGMSVRNPLGRLDRDGGVFPGISRYRPIPVQEPR